MTSSTPQQVDLRDDQILAGQFMHFDAHRRVAEQRSQLSQATRRLLWLLSDGQGRTLRDIATELGLEQSTVNRQVNGALDAQLVQRSRRAGQTAFEFTSTAKGRKAFQHDVENLLGLFADALDRLGPDDAQQFLALMGRFVDAYGDVVGPSQRQA